MRHAVEASVSRAKQLGAVSNLYIVEGSQVAYAHGSKGDGNEAFLVSTRSNRKPTRVAYLQETNFQIETLWPRPNVGQGWTRDETTGLWSPPIVILSDNSG